MNARRAAAAPATIPFPTICSAPPLLALVLELVEPAGLGEPWAACVALEVLEVVEPVEPVADEVPLALDEQP